MRSVAPSFSKKDFNRDFSDLEKSLITVVKRLVDGTATKNLVAQSISRSGASIASTHCKIISAGNSFFSNNKVMSSIGIF